MATKSDTKKQLEAILGRKLEDDEAQAIQITIPVALSTITQGHTIHQNVTTSQVPNRCEVTNVLDVSGFAKTASNGQSLFRLSNFICPTGAAFFRPINVVATPVLIKPCYLTVIHSLLNNGADVEIRVFTFNANGAAAPNVPFNWRCRVGLTTIL